MYNEVTIKELKKSLSEQRFATYLKKAQNDEILALELYLYNLRLAESLFLPLNITEVTLRNTVDEVLVSKFGHDWYLNHHFQCHVLNDKSRESLDEAIERVKQKKKQKRKKIIAKNKTSNKETIRHNRGKIISETTFGFWLNLLTRKEYSEKIWGTEIYIPFPYLKKSESLDTIRKLARTIGFLRNRVAHHEPIFNMNIPDLYKKMVRLTQAQTYITAQWMEQHSRVNEVIRTKPK